MCTYLQKKAEAKRRGIPFTLTEEQWDFLIKIKEDANTKCAYTGQTFIFKQNHPQCASLERMENHVEFKDNKCVIHLTFYCFFSLLTADSREASGSIIL